MARTEYERRFARDADGQPDTRWPITPTVTVSTRTVGACYGTVAVLTYADGALAAEGHVCAYGHVEAAVADGHALAADRGWRVVEDEAA